MKKFLNLMVLALFACGTILMAGCGEEAAAPKGDDANKDASTATSTDQQQADAVSADNATEEVAVATPYSPQMSEDGEFQMVSLKLPNMT